MNLHETLVNIQKNLKAPKNQVNKFGNYKYRNCEDILEAVKPLLGDCVLVIADEVVEIGGRHYVEATVSLRSKIQSDDEPNYSATAFAREPESRKGMDESQITGAASSYARKYALNGLFCIDDTKDADSSQPAQKPVDVNAQMAMFKSLCNDRGMTEDEVNDMENAVCNAKKNPNFQDLVSSVVDNFEKTYKWWMEIEK
jgi:hypothetical protein